MSEPARRAGGQTRATVNMGRVVGSAWAFGSPPGPALSARMGKSRLV